MAAPSHAEEKFHEALRALVGAASQRKRLESAYLDNLSDLQAAELPISQQAKFVRLRDTLTHGKRSEEHTSELQSQSNLVCRLLLENKQRRRRRSPSVP